MTRSCPPPDTLSALADDALTPGIREDVLAHVSACPCCSAKLEDLRALRAAFGSLPPTPLGTDLATALLPRLAATAHTPDEMPRPPARGPVTRLAGWKDFLRAILAPSAASAAALGLGLQLGAILLAPPTPQPVAQPVVLTAMSLFGSMPPGNLCPRPDACNPTGNPQ